MTIESRKAFLVLFFSLFLLIGAVSADLTQFYNDDANTTRDGYLISRNVPHVTSSDLRNLVANYVFSANTSEIGPMYLKSSATTNRWNESRFYFISWDTSSIPDTATIDSAEVCFYATSDTYSTFSTIPNISVFGWNAIDPNAVTVSDFPNLTSVRYADAKTQGTWDTDGYRCFALYSPLATNNISKTGYTSMGLAFWRFADVSILDAIWQASKTTYAYVYDSSYTGTSRDPYLNVTWTAGGSAPTADFTVPRTTGGYGAPIQFTDTSTGSPTSWYWMFGDGNTSTSQNPLHVYDVQGTHYVNMSATNAFGTSWKNGTTIIISSRPDYYINPYALMVPWLDQSNETNSVGICAGMAAAYSAMLMRYEELGTTPSAVQEPYTRDVSYSLSGMNVKNDRHVESAPSPASYYFPFIEAPGGNKWNITALGEAMKLGYNLGTDQITDKNNETEWYYPQPESYLDAHRYNKITSYDSYTGNSTGFWEGLKMNITDNHVVVIQIKTYSNDHNNSTMVTLENGQIAVQRAAPTGSQTDGHYLACFETDNTRDSIGCLESWGETRLDGTPWTKTEVITKSYWQYDPNPGKFFVPKDLVVDEVLVPTGVTNLTNATADCNSVQTNWTNPKHLDFNHTVVKANGATKTFASNTSLGYKITGLSSLTEYTLTLQTCDFVACNSTPEQLTINTESCATPTATPTTTATTTATPTPTSPPSEELRAGFASNVTCGSIPFNVLFTDVSVGNSITDYYWDFGNYTNTTLMTANNTYEIAGMYPVYHSVTNASGSSWKNESKYIRAVPEWETCPVTVTITYRGALLNPSVEEAKSRIDQAFVILGTWWWLIALLALVWILFR